MSTTRVTIRLALGAAALLLSAVTAVAQAGAGGEARAEAGLYAGVIPPPQPRRVDSFGDIPSNDLKARLDAFAVDLQNEPGATGLIISYVDRRCRTTRVRGKEGVMRSYLVDTRGLDAGRLAILDGGRRRNITFELWVIPRTDTRPALTPTLSPCNPPRPPRGRRRRP